jgi:hypothetical protein
VALVATTVLAMSGTTAVASAQGGDEEPEATEIGITDDEIRVAVIADVENPLAPGLFDGARKGVEGWAEYVNKNGGLAGRDVVVDFIDSHLSADDARNAFITACSENFAVIGAAALFLNNVDDIESCVDQAGNPTGLPDLAVVTTEVVQQCSPTTFAINPPQILCDTRTESPQTYQGNAGRYYYYAKEFGKDLHGSYLYSADLRAANNANRATMEPMQKLGIEADDEVDISARAPQSEYTPVVQSMKDNESNYAQSGASFNTTVSLRKEAKLQGVTDPDIIWDCTLQCYDKNLIEQGGADVEDQFVSLLFLPFEEASTNKELKAFVNTVGKDEVDGFGAQAWASGVLFQQAVEQIVDDQGVNGVNRQALFGALNSITDFDANGMIGTVNIADRETSPCYVLLQVQDGKFKRVAPSKKGTFNCDKKNVQQVELDLETGA